MDLKNEQKEKFEQIKQRVETELTKDLDNINKNCGELEMNGKNYVVVPCDTNFSGFVTKAIEMTYVEVDTGLIKEIEKLRNELYRSLPTGEIDSFEMLKAIKAHIKKLDLLTDDGTKRVPAGSQIKRGGMS